MSNSCKVVPDAPNGNPSILFQELRAKTKDRELSKTIWAFTQTELFKSEFNDMPKDENGEITFDAVSEILQLDRILDQSEKDANLAIDQGLLKLNGEPNKFNSASEALSKAKVYNATSESKIAVVTETEDGKYVATVYDKSINSVANASRQSSLAELNAGLIDLINKAGFTVRFADDPSYDGIFNPLLARENADELKTVIEVANGERGEKALPEEISHLILAGLEQDELKKRLDRVFTPDVVKTVLGERYDEYYKKYSKGKTPVDIRLRDEAEGQALAAMLKGDDEFYEGIRARTEAEKAAEQHKSLLSRIWNKAKSMFRKITKQDIDSVIQKIQDTTSPIADIVRDESVLERLSKEDIMNHELLYDLNDRVNEAIGVVEEGIAKLEQRLTIMKASQGAEEDPRPLIKAIEKAQKELTVQNYHSACLSILNYIGQEVQDIILESDAMGHIYRPADDLETVAINASLVDRMTTAIRGYMPYLLTLKELPELVEEGEIELTESSAKILSDLASKYMDSLSALDVEMKRKRKNVLKQLVSLYYGNNGEKPEDFVETDKIKWQSVDMLLTEAERDISFWDTNIFSAGDSRNPLINVIHHIIKSQQDKRNNIINSYCAIMQRAEANLRAHGHDNKFIYKLDANGKPTGYFVAPMDMKKFEDARESYYASVEEMEISADEKRDLINEWESKNTKEVEVGEPIGPNGERRVETMPDPEIYKDDTFQQGWDDSQKEYYRTVLQVKAAMDAELPIPMQCLYRAPQVKKSVTQMFDKDGPGALRTIWTNFKKNNSITTENTEYGEYLNVKADFRGKEIKRIPIYFTRMLEDRQDLSTDGTHAMFNYICMAVNYSEIGKLANVMRLMQDHVSEDGNYTVKKVRGGKVLKNIIHGITGTWTQNHTDTGRDTNVANAINSLIDRTVFNMTKKPLPITQVTEKWAIDWNQVANVFMKITSFARMGINPLSAITNATQGESQMITEAIAGRFFNMKDLLWSKKAYFQMLPAYMGQFNSVDRKDKMYLLINQFNSSEDFFRDMMDRDFNKSAMKRVMGRGNIYFLNTMGEHYLHTSGMLSILHHEKVKLVHQKNKDGSPKIVSLYDAIKTVEDENGAHLELIDDIEFLDNKKAFLMGNELRGKSVITKDDRDALFEGLAGYINNINDSLHGGYSQIERGNWNKLFIVRAILQFRQWMFGMFNRLYSGSYYDATLKMQREGAYRTMYRQLKTFFTATLHDMKTMSIKMAIENNRLSEQERQNARVAWAQSGMVCLLWLISLMTKGLPDEDNRAKRLFAYSLKRLQLETGALAIVPNPIGFGKNIFTLIQSPAAGVQTLDTLLALLEIGSMWEDIESGRYKGWSRMEKAAFSLTPLYNVQKLIDMKNYNYMFNIFK